MFCIHIQMILYCQYTIFLTLYVYTVYNVQYTVYGVQYTVYNVLYTVYSVQYTAYSVLFNRITLLCERRIQSCPGYTRCLELMTVIDRPRTVDHGQRSDVITR